MFNLFYGGGRKNRMRTPVGNGGNNLQRGRFGLITRRCLYTAADGQTTQTCSGLGSAFALFGGPGHTDCTEICANCLGSGATGYFIDVPGGMKQRK